MPNVKIIGLGRYLPQKNVLSSELDNKHGLPVGSIQKKSGLISRYFASEEETTSYMAAQAANSAALNAQIDLTSIDAIISACGAGEQPIPCTAALIQKQLGLGQSGIACFDINSTCLSFITALDVASHLIEGKRFKRILIVSSDIASAGINWQDMETCTLFGDGAAACIIEKSDGSNKILAAHFETHSIGSQYCQVEAGGTRLPLAKAVNQLERGLFYMEGKQVFKLASKLLDNLIDQIFLQTNLSLNDVSWVVPHQASMLAMLHLQKRLGLPPEKVVNIFAYHGNQIAASVPTALCHLNQSGNLQRGQVVLLLGTGAGLSAGALLLEY